jgi:hypothetical protein
MQITIPAEGIHAVVKKIVRGCEYWLAGGRIVESPYEIEAFFPTETPDEVRKLMAAFALGPVYLERDCESEGEARKTIAYPHSTNS